MGERDTCSQVRIPIRLVADEVHKLCANVKTWEDIKGMYENVANEAESKFGGDAAQAGAAAGKTTKQEDVEACIAQHNLRDVIQQAVSEVCASQAADPIAALQAALAKHK